MEIELRWGRFWRSPVDASLILEEDGAEKDMEREGTYRELLAVGGNSAVYVGLAPASEDRRGGWRGCDEYHASDVHLQEAYLRSRQRPPLEGWRVDAMHAAATSTVGIVVVIRDAQAGEDGGRRF